MLLKINFNKMSNYYYYSYIEQKRNLTEPNLKHF